MSVLSSCRRAIESIHLEGSVVICDDGGAMALESVGGSPYVIGDLGALTVISLEEGKARDVNTALEIREKLECWDRSRVDNFSNDSSKPFRVVFLVTQVLWDAEEFFGTVLSGSFSIKWIVAQICCTTSIVAHNAHASRKARDRGMDFTAYGLQVQNFARPNAVEVKVMYLPFHLCPHVESMGRNLNGVFSLNNVSLSSLFPITLRRLDLLHRSDVSQVDGNEDLKARTKSDLKTLAWTLTELIRNQLQLDVTSNCWAAGFTSRVIGNALLDYTNDLPSDTLLQKATLILVDRTVDLSSAIFQSEIPLAQSMHNVIESKQIAAVENGEILEKTLGNLSIRYGSRDKQSHLLESLVLDSPSYAVTQLTQAIGGDEGVGLLEALNKAFQDRCGYLQHLATYHLAAGALLAITQAERNAQWHTLERTLTQGGVQPSDLINILKDLVQCGNVPLRVILQLTIAAYAMLSSMRGQKIDEAVLTDFERHFTKAIEQADSKDPVWKLIADSDSSHVVGVLREILSSEQNRRYVNNDDGKPLLAQLVSQGATGQASLLQPLGETALQATAKDLGRNLMSVFGFGSSSTAKDDDDSNSTQPNPNRKKLNLTDCNICVIFVIGGITFTEVNQVIETARNLGLQTKFMIGSTCITTPEKVTMKLLEKDR